MCQFSIGEKREQERAAGIYVPILQKIVSDIPVSIHIEISISLTTLEESLQENEW